MLLLLIFYEKGHAWRKEQVVVGFQFTSNIPFDDTQNIHEQIIAQTNFRGSWVTAKETVSNKSLIYSRSRLNNIFTKFIENESGQNCEKLRLKNNFSLHYLLRSETIKKNKLITFFSLNRNTLQDTETLEVPNTDFSNPNAIQLIKIPKLDPKNSTEDVSD
jgi:hypothetical protein